MLTISHLRQYIPQVQAVIPEIRKAEMAVTVENLMKLMREHEEGDNILLLTLVPEHDLTGNQDSTKWDNTVGFYFLEKTDYSEHDRDGYLSIFERTQTVAKKFVDKLLVDKADNEGLFCGFLAFLDESSVSLSPTVALNGCNGYYLQLSMKSNL
jgi:hypothetical protein